MVPQDAKDMQLPRGREKVVSETSFYPIAFPHQSTEAGGDKKKIGSNKYDNLKVMAITHGGGKCVSLSLKLCLLSL